MTASVEFSPPPPRTATPLETQRAARYSALVQLIDEMQRPRDIDEVAQVAATRWKHCAHVSAWRLLCVHRDRVALVEAQEGHCDVKQLSLTALSSWDAQQWVHALPRYFRGDALRDMRGELPAHLAATDTAELAVLPVLQGGVTIALLCASSSRAAFDPLDRKFLAHVATALAGRIVTILTEQALSGDLVQAEQRLAQQVQAATLARLVNGVAHELNTPLGVQLSACDALAGKLQQSAGTDEVLEIVDLVARQARRAVTIVRRLKQISAVSAGATRLATPLLETVEAIAQAFAERADAPQIELVGDVEVVLELDREALRAVLFELMDNAAVHARRADGTPCELTFELQTSNGSTKLSIRDDGPGMDDATAARLFEPFATTRQSHGHMGLGGYIARSLASDALHGELRLLRGEPGDTGGVWLQLDFCDRDAAGTSDYDLF